MSRNHIYDELRILLKEIENRYQAARNGQSFDFETEIKPFLKDNEQRVAQIKSFQTDTRFTPSAREKMHDEFMEMLMSCHIASFSVKLYHERLKYINVWLDHAYKESLI